jgi:histidinol phosphatase-like PHP family hydrolase
MEKKIHDWSGGAFVHNHFRIEDILNQQPPEVIPPEISKYMRRYTDGSFSLKAITSFLEEVFGEKMLITDTQHPSYVLDENYDDFEDADKIKFFEPSVKEKTVDLLTECILQRAKIIKEHGDVPNVLTGVEADILSGKGEMTVRNPGLKQLDFVTASFHSSIWHAAGNETAKKGSDVIDMYHYIVENQNVDMISHPTLYLPDDVKEKMSPQDWTELLTHMRDANVAFEISLDSTNLTYTRGRNIDREIITEAIKIGTPLIIGFDFHYLSDWGVSPSPKLVLDPNEARSIFQASVRNGSISKLLSRVLGNIYALEEMGVRPHNIVNSKQDKFVQWLSKRNSK